MSSMRKRPEGKLNLQNRRDDKNEAAAANVN